jgi:hypothetical protein
MRTGRGASSALHIFSRLRFPAMLISLLPDLCKVGRVS